MHQDSSPSSSRTTSSNGSNVTRPPFNHSNSCPNIPELKFTVDGDDENLNEKQPSILSHPSDSEHEKTDDEKDNHSSVSNTDTLLEAALEREEAQDRHTRYQEHIARSAALVDRMLNDTRGNDAANNLQRFRSSNSIVDEEPGGEESISAGLPYSMGGAAMGTGGSVLSSLMKLEAQRRQKEQQKRERKKTKKVGAIFSGNRNIFAHSNTSSHMQATIYAL
ncbi:hypothetical protein K492DRAFT_10069 [Lichtheimia hyalospora FSU 10163]|nr:hypothetical protein K492DRAFT_10069 [Lichtheimia hyalospora FSU 10163]